MIFTIHEYLTEKFSGEFVFEDLVQHFLTEFGVRVKKFENKYLFKYDTILADFSKDITHQCRGVILYYMNGVWSYHSKPFIKFFNLSEGKHKWFDEKVLESDLKYIRLLEKKDGSCIQVAFDRELGDFRASTLGSIQTESCFDEPYTFSDLFWKLIDPKFKFIVGNTYIFELCAQANQVVTTYSTEHVTLLAIRLPDEFFMSRGDLIRYVETTNVQLPIQIEKIFTSKKEIEEFVEAESKNEDVYGKIPEGFVAYHLSNYSPIFKCKNEKYHQYHLINTGDRRFVRKNLVKAFFSGNIDDIYGELNNDNKDFVDRLRNEVLRLEESFKAIFFMFSGITDRKTYALKVQGLAKINKDVAMVQGIFFENYSAISSGTPISFLDAITGKKSNYTENDHWREI